MKRHTNRRPGFANNSVLKPFYRRNVQPIDKQLLLLMTVWPSSKLRLTSLHASRPCSSCCGDRLWVRMR